MTAAAAAAGTLTPPLFARRVAARSVARPLVLLLGGSHCLQGRCSRGPAGPQEALQGLFLEDC